MTTFFDKVITKVVSNVDNNYTDNHDEFRFGPRPALKKDSPVKETLRKVLFKRRVRIEEMHTYMGKLYPLAKYEDGLEALYHALADDTSRELLVDLISFKILGAQKFKLKTNKPENARQIEEIERMSDRQERIDPKFLSIILHKYDLRPMGKDVRMFFSGPGIHADFYLEQYRYNHNGIEIAADPGDAVIDAGGCWGDTAIYFADRVGPAGKVYTFEFIPNNIAILQKNLALNPNLEPHVQLVPHPLWNVSDKKIYFKDMGPGSKISFDKFEEMEGSTETLTIDDFVTRNNVPRIDFIKMDIEGAEGNALEGARKTIERFRPKLAIAIYHNMDQFVGVPKWILDLDLGYKIYLDHFTIHEEETIIYAVAND
jgi:FkbM family methyltransferase